MNLRIPNRFLVACAGLMVVAAGAAEQLPDLPIPQRTTVSTVGNTSQVLQSIIVPPTAERTVVFSDRGRTYIVGLTSGSVTYLDTGPQPVPPPNPNPNPPAPVPPNPIPPNPAPPDLQPFPLQVFQTFTQNPNIADKPAVAKELDFCIEVTLAVAGGLGQDTQAILKTLGENISLRQLGPKLVGFPLGDLLKSQGSQREQLIQALQDVSTAMRAVK